MGKYLTKEGIALSETSYDSPLMLEYVLQKYRDVWVLIAEHPYLSIDQDKINLHLKEINEFAVFSSSLLYQNISREEFGQRVLSSLIGHGLTGGTSQDSKFLVEGVANPQANGLLQFNPLLMIGTHPFAASGTRYMYVSDDGIYQRTFAELITINKRSRPKSAHVNFNELSGLIEEYYSDYLNNKESTSIDLSRLSDLLDLIFIENEIILSAATEHHHAMAPHEVALDYPAPILTKYGRLTHDTNGTPRIEVSFSLLHYESALREFDSLKKANDDNDAYFRHGVYCVVAAAACVEAIANNLVFAATSQHPDHRDRRPPLQKIDDSAEIIAQDQGNSFNLMSLQTSICNDLDTLRIARNSFMHAKEIESDIDPVSRKAFCAADVDEESCRRYLKSLREAISFIYDQLPNISPPIVTRTNITWLVDLEVP